MTLLMRSGSRRFRGVFEMMPHLRTLEFDDVGTQLPMRRKLDRMVVVVQKEAGMWRRIRRRSERVLA